jgi:hypothetical protein
MCVDKRQSFYLITIYNLQFYTLGHVQCTRAEASFVFLNFCLITSKAVRIKGKVCQH